MEPILRTAYVVMTLFAFSYFGYVSTQSNDADKFDVHSSDQRLAKNDPVFIESIDDLRESAPQAHELIMKKVNNGATVAEIKQYIYNGE